MVVNNYYVYEWYITETNEVFYVGKGKGNRYKTKKRNKFFNDMYDTHDCDVRIVKNNLSEHDAFEEEKKLIAYYKENTNYRLTNQTDGGEGTSGWIPSENFKIKQSIINKQRWKNPEYRAKMVVIRNAVDGPYKRKEFRDKISKLVKGDRNPNYGNSWSDKQKNHLSKIRKEKQLAVDENNPKATKIICLETGEIFTLIKKAAEKYHIENEAMFSIALKERHRTVGGLHWMKFSSELYDKDKRFHELLISLSLSEKCTIVGIETHETFNDRKSFLKKYNLGIKKFIKEYEINKKIVVNGTTYMYVKDYLGRLTQ